MLTILSTPSALLNACVLCSPAPQAPELELSGLLRPDALVVLEIPDVAAARAGLAAAPILGPWLRGSADERSWDADGPSELDILALIFAPTVHGESLAALGPEVQVLIEGLRAFEGQVALGMVFDDLDLFWDTDTDETGPALLTLIGEYPDGRDFVVDTLVPLFGAEIEPYEWVHDDLSWWAFDLGDGSRMALAGTDGLLLVVYSDGEVFEAELEELSATLASGEPRGFESAEREFKSIAEPLMRLSMTSLPLDLPATMQAKARKTLGADPSTTLVAGLHMGAEGLAFEFVTDWDWGTALGFDEHIFGPAPMHLVNGTNAPWTSAFALRLDLGLLLEWIMQVAIDSGELPDMDLDSALEFAYGMVSQVLGVDVQSDLLDLMSGEIACAGLPVDELDAEGPAAMLHALGFGVILLGTDESSFLADALLDVMVFQGLEYTEESADDASWYELELGLGLPLCIGAARGHTVLSFGREGLLAALGSPRSGDSALLRDLEEDLEEASFAWVLDVDRVLNPVLAMMDVDSEVSALLADLPAGARLVATQGIDGKFWRHTLRCLARSAK